MTTVLLTNIGTSDLKFEGDFLGMEQRAKAEEILEGLQEDFELYRSELEFPILEPIIDELKKIDLLILFATDQHQGITEERFWKRDTINVAKVIKTVFEKDPDFQSKLYNVEIVPVINSPNDYDQMFREYQEFFKDQVAKVLRRAGLKNPDESFISITGGTPACNLALMYAGMHDNSLGFKQFVYRSESEKEKPVKLLELGKAIQRQRIVQLADHFLRLYNYEGLAEFVRGFSRNDNQLQLFLTALNYRKNFRFQEALNLLNEILKKAEGETRRVFRVVKEEIKMVQAGINQLNKDFSGDRFTPEVRAVLAELFWNAKICYDTGDYVGFLGRFFRLQESLLRLAVESKLGISTAKWNREKLMRKIQVDETLLKYLKENKVDLNRELNRYMCYHLVSYFLDEEDRFVKWLEKGGVGATGEKLVDLRNRCILGHEFEGVNEEIIKKRWQGNILKETENLLKDYFGVISRPDSIEAAHEWVLGTIFRNL